MYATGPAVKTSNPRLPPRDADRAVGGIRTWAERSGRRARTTTDTTPIARPYPQIHRNIAMAMNPVIDLNDENGRGRGRYRLPHGSLAQAPPGNTCLSCDRAGRFVHGDRNAVGKRRAVSPLQRLGACWVVDVAREKSGILRPLSESERIAMFEAPSDGAVVRFDDLDPRWNTLHAREPGHYRWLISCYGWWDHRSRTCKATAWRQTARRCRRTASRPLCWAQRPLV
jgi:hypothetical protein